MKLLFLIMDPVWMLVIAGLITYIISLRRRMAALNNPILMLSRKDRRQWALKELLEREHDKELVRFRRNMAIINQEEESEA